MLLDLLLVIGVALMACVFVLVGKDTATWQAKVNSPQHLWAAAIWILGYAISVVLNCEKLNLYTPEQQTSVLQEQIQVLQANAGSGLLLALILYLLHSTNSDTTIIVATVLLAPLVLGVRRLAARTVLHRGLRSVAGARNVLIVGTGNCAQALRNHLDKMRHFGYDFKGFIEGPGVDSGVSCPARDVVGTLESIFDAIRRQFVDEIFVAAPCDRRAMQRLLAIAQDHGVNVRLVFDLYDSWITTASLEYLGEFPTVQLYRRSVPEGRLLLKRMLDVGIAATALVALSPLFLIIAILIKRDSQGRVFHVSERVGKKGRAFQFYKFRTMVPDAEKQRHALSPQNQRDRILFKLDNDPRITRIGRFLRKYSLDELPQLLNVLRGDMSLVGPRPPLACEVNQYQLNHLRRLEVTPGITGLWQVEARNDPSFHKYVALDLAYIENWSIRLDLGILWRTIGVVFAGTGL